MEPAVLRAAAMIAALVAAVRRRWRSAVFLLVAVETTGVLTTVAKNSVGRPRPVTALVAATSTSFPSGHALGVMAAVSAFLVLALPALGRASRVGALGVGVLVVGSVGFARVALNVHHPSDVLAGWALGWAYVMVWALIVQPWRTRGEPRRAVAGV